MTGTYERKQFVGGAPATTVSGALTDAATSLTIDSASGWPDATNPFVAVIDRGLASEEKILVGARTTTTLSSITRGYDDTSAQAHSSGAAIEHVIDASTIDQVNRLANLQDAKGEVLGHNGTNPVAVDAGGTDDHVLLVDSGEAAGIKFGRLPTVEDTGSAPSVSGVVRVWFDSSTGMLRSSNGTVWRTPASAPVFANTAARDAYFGATPTQDGIVCIVGTGATLQLQAWDGSAWIEFPTIYEGIPKFADSTARDAFFTSPVTGDHAYLNDVHQLTEYREDEWIIINNKVIYSASAPASPHEGDIWIQPT